MNKHTEHINKEKKKLLKNLNLFINLKKNYLQLNNDRKTNFLHYSIMMTYSFMIQMKFCNVPKRKLKYRLHI